VDQDIEGRQEPVGNPKKDREPDKEAHLVQDRWVSATQAIYNRMRDYQLNQAFLDGDQWLYWSKESSRLERIPRDPEKIQGVFNRILSNSSSLMSKLMQRELTFEVIPTDVDDSHVRGARLAESQLENVRREHRWERLRELGNWATWTGGTAAICVEWDKDAGDPASSPDDTGGRQRRMGDTKETLLNITEFSVEPGTKDAETARWWVKCQLLPPKEVQATYGLEWCPAADSAYGGAPYLVRLPNHDGTTIPLTKVLTLYERPNGLCPKGRVVVVVNEQSIWKGEWPFPWRNRLNLVTMDETPSGDGWAGSTRLTAARGVQVFYNQANNNIEEHMKRASNARMAVPQSSVNMMDDFTDLPGELIPYADGTTPPQWLSPAQVAQWVIDRPTQLAEVIDDIMGIHEVTRGEAPANIESGYGLSILAEHDASPTNRFSKVQADAWSKIGTMVLKLLEQNVKGPKRKSVIDTPGQGSRTIEWSGEDFRGQTQAVVPPDSIIPRSRAAQLEFAKQAMEMGLIDSVAQFVQVADLPDAKHILSAVAPDIARARHENAGFGHGEQSEVYEWDDHEAHITEHNNYRKTVDFSLLDKKVKDMIAMHIQAHVTSEAEKIGKQQMAGAIGGPGLAGAPTAAGAALPPELNPTFTGLEVPPDPMEEMAMQEAMAPEDPAVAEANQQAEIQALAEEIFRQQQEAANTPDEMI
jgi:hypothetical protein